MYAERTDKGSPEIVQWKLYVPAEVRHTVRVEAAKRDLSMSRFITEVVREVVARERAASPRDAGGDDAAVAQ